VTRLRPSLVLALALAGLATSCGGGEPALLEKASVVLITLDTTRADAVGCYGGPAGTTPTLDRLAAEGVRFDQARSTCPVTLPAHTSILTGLLPFEHGVRDNGTFRLGDEVTTLAERMRHGGYSTAAVVGAIVLHSDYGLDQGFDVYSDVPRRKLEMDTVEDQRRADEVVDEALRILGDGLEPPYFLWLHLFDPHRPLDPPPAYRARAMEGTGPGTPVEELERRVYHAEVAFADAELGRFLAELEARGDAPLIAVAADHGEGFGDHGEPAHGLSLFDSVMRVPMILRHSALPAGQVVRAPVSTADLTPTILALVGLDTEGTTTSDLTPLMLQPSEARRPSVYFETCHPYYSYGWAPLFGLVEGSGSAKVVVGPRPAVYDLRGDPGELRNVLADNPSIHSKATAALELLAPRTVASQRVALDEEGAQALEQLGYTAGAGKEDAGPILPGTIDPQLPDPVESIPVKLLCQDAVGYMVAGDNVRSIEAIREVLELDPDNPIFLSQAGTIYITAGRPAEALPVLARSVELREDASARCSLAIAHNLTGDKDTAIEVLRLNASLHPRHLHTRFALGELLLERGDAAEAAEQFEAFLAEHDLKDAWHQRASELLAEARSKAVGG
jgi:arylsulfatase A-like enzyme